MSNKIVHLATTRQQVIRLSRTGMSQRQIGTRLGISHVRVCRILKEARAEGISLSDNELVAQALHVVHCHLTGLPVGNVIPTAQTQLGAAQAVLERAFPKVRVTVTPDLSIRDAIQMAEARLGNIPDADTDGCTDATGLYSGPHCFR